MFIAIFTALRSISHFFITSEQKVKKSSSKPPKKLGSKVCTFWSLKMLFEMAFH